MHARLANMTNSWQSNEIAEKIRKQKEADMAVLGNRWKNGGIHEEEEVRFTLKNEIDVSQPRSIVLK